MYGTMLEDPSRGDLSGVFEIANTERVQWQMRRRLTLFIGAAVLFGTACLYNALPPRTTSPRHRLGMTEPSLDDSLPGIGFQLTPSYGTSAVRYPNGSFSNLARVDFSTETVDRSPEPFYHMMQRLAEFKSHRDPFASYCHDDGIGVSPFPTRRSLRKAARRLIGLPSTEDVGRLADAIRSLKEESEKKLGHPINSVKVTAPAFAQLCRQDIKEATEYVGLTSLETGTFSPFDAQPHDMSAAYAGYGLGICEDYKNATRCREEENSMPKKCTLTVLYTQDVLLTYKTEMQLAVISLPLDPRGVYMLDWQAGSRHGFRSQLQREVYWELVALKLMELPLERNFPAGDVERVVLMGESAEMEEVRTAVEQAMTRSQGSVPEIYQEGTEYVAARGAADFALRAVNA